MNLYKKHIVLTVLCTLVTLLALFVIYISSPISSELQPSTFQRNFAKEIVGLLKIESLGRPSNYIAGFDEKRIWFGNYDRPSKLKSMDLSLQDQQEVEIKLEKVDSIVEPGRFRTIVNRDRFFLTNGIMPIILTGDKKNWTAREIKFSKYFYFNSAFPINDTTFVLQAYNTEKKGLQLGLLVLADSPKFKFNDNLLTPQQEGIFSVQGQTDYNNETNTLTYLYTYRNQYLVIDNDLNLKGTGNTIDTFRTAPITVREVDNDGTSMLSSPPFATNPCSTLSGDFLYVRSNLLAKNENKGKFLISSTIDVYNINTKEYVLSFHIPNLTNKSITEFKIIDDKIYALFDDTVGLFELKALKDLQSKSISKK
ncbi:hypothetical protein [Dawidia soli]|uniref:Uncharacterized protein n=1 Tax=Dawidia soli TaxID=2782352 RepID=A0AAP2DED7_9BACT|nr:hypothetical protein [Dawidia soli]MBT1689235.1 hypothetical protein [Dawidia soli]